MVQCNNMTVQYLNSTPAKTVLNNISFRIAPGKITCLVGPSGAGKTTLLRTIAQLNMSYQGTVLVDGIDAKKLTPAQRSTMIGMVFQHFNLFPHMTVLQNCMQPMLVVQNMTTELARQRAHALLTQLDIVHLAQSYPAQLSGGQQQRVAIARALCLAPRVLLLDEPTSALDPSNVMSLQNLLRSLAAQGLTIMISSHDIGFVQGVLDHGHLVDAGTIRQSFAAGEFHAPAQGTHLWRFLRKEHHVEI